jgi:D-beta-D-heptose 7-phosphate kinase/D-beta-D-heptose 1-phosphate adenosyltransferase
VKIQIPPFESASVLVVGDVMLDRYWHGGTSRISPEAPVPVVHVGEREERAGGAGNVGLNIVALGARATLIGVTGDDEAGASLERLLAEAGVSCRFLCQAGAHTVTKLRVLSRHQQLIRLDFEDGFPDLDGKRLLAAFDRALADASVVVLSDYGKGVLRDVPALIERARRAGRPVLIDPKGTDFERYRGATLITPNLAEFEAVAGPCRDEAELVAKGMDLLQRIDLEALLVTRSEHGMTLLRRGLDPLHLPTRAREVFDVTGAGDTVISTLAAALAAGDSLPAATVLSNLAAGIVVGKLGTATVSVPELRHALHDGDRSGSGVMDEDELLVAVHDARARGETVVMTNGCFDILHPGHVGYLEQAASLGDRLIVAVNDDESVRRLKGPERPVNSLAERMAVLAGLRAVDWVVPFAEDTPERIICRIRPDYLVKGGDYRPEEIAGHDCVTAHGGRVEILQFFDGCSSTATIERIRNIPNQVGETDT